MTAALLVSIACVLALSTTGLLLVRLPRRAGDVAVRKRPFHKTNADEGRGRCSAHASFADTFAQAAVRISRVEAPNARQSENGGAEDVLTMWIAKVASQMASEFEERDTTRDAEMAAERALPGTRQCVLTVSAGDLVCRADPMSDKPRGASSRFDEYG